MNSLIRVKKWIEFKKIADELKPKAIVYSIDQYGKTKNKELTCLRLIMPTQNKCYIYIDIPKVEKLRETRIPIHKNRETPRYLEDQDIIFFIRNQLDRKDLNVHSFWTT